ELRLTFVGDGPARASLKAEARRRGVAAEFVPVVEHRRVPAYLAAADAFVLPSRTEGHPKALLEAMSAGVPCVASNVGGNRAVIEAGATGLLFDLGDPGGLAEALARVLGDPEGARALAARARARAAAARPGPALGASRPRGGRAPRRRRRRPGSAPPRRERGLGRVRRGPPVRRLARGRDARDRARPRPGWHGGAHGAVLPSR